jgi:uncharacterized protein
MSFRRLSVFFSVAVLFLAVAVPAQTNKYYPSGVSPLLATKYVKLPFGAVMPQGWLNTQLNLQVNAITGHVDEFYTPLKTLAGLDLPTEYLFCYYEGLVDLAYLMNDSTLKIKAKTAVDYFINSAKSNGNFLSSTADTAEGFDHVSICRFLIEYYEITGDSRVIPFMTNYFHYVAKVGLAGNSWSTDRSPEHVPVGYWLYNHTGDTLILTALKKGCKTKTDNWLSHYQNFPTYDKDTVNKDTIYSEFKHNVNIGHAFKYALYYLMSKDTAYKQLYTKGLELVDKYHGSVCGRFNADENFTGKQPTRGMELCGVVEMSLSMEKLFEAYGDIPIADRAEFLMYNCFAGTNTGDMWGHQYDQQANQVRVNSASRPWNGNDNTSNLYGLKPNWPCCLCNVHQAWPRFVEHMWMATQNNGLMAALYGPSKVTAQVGADTTTATITESTEYPFDGTVGFKVTVSKTDSFPICFRIPQWESGATVQIGAATVATPAAGTVCTLNRTWQTGDSVTLTFPMTIRSDRRWNRSMCIMRGPLWYSLKIGETWTKLSSSVNYMGSADWQIMPTTAWNIALKVDSANPKNSFTVVRNSISSVPFAQKGEQVYLPGSSVFTTWTQDPPVVLKAQGRIVTSWTYNTTYTSNAADPPTSPLTSTVTGKDTSIELIPYGSAKLRVTELPWINASTAVLPVTKALQVQEQLAVSAQNGQCHFTIRPSGKFNVELLDVAGRVVYHMNAKGPQSFTLGKNIVHNGMYVAHIVSGDLSLQQKLLVVQ